MKKITVLLAEDHKIVREGIRSLLEAQPDLTVVGEAQNGREAVEFANQLRPDVIVMDIAMPGLNGLEASRRLIKALPDSKILILSAYGEDAYVEWAASIGAAGFILKQSSSGSLARAIRDVQAGKRVFSAAIVQRYWEQESPVRPGKRFKQLANLTSREMETLKLIAEGNANKQIAAELDISIQTVEKHRSSLMRKLKINDTKTLTRYAISTGVIESPV